MMPRFLFLLAVGALASGCTKPFFEVSTISPDGTEGSSSGFSSRAGDGANFEFDS